MAELYEVFGAVMTAQEMLMDKRCHPELDWDIIRKRLKRGGSLGIPEMAMTVPLVKGAQVGDTKERIRDRKLKAREKYKAFVLAKKVREKYNAGVDRAEIRERYDITEGFLQKIIGKTVLFNWAWDLCGPDQVPDHFKELKKELEDVHGAKDGLDSIINE